MHSTYRKGEIAQLKVQLRAVELGILTSKPTTEARYDLVLDFKGKLERGQIKYAGSVVTPGVVTLDLRKQTRNNGVSRTYSSEEIDMLYVYVAPVDKIVRIPPTLFHNRKHLSLRWAPGGSTFGRKDAVVVSDFIW